MVKSTTKTLVKDSNGLSPLHHAASKGKLEVVKYFVDEKKINPNVRDNNGVTSLHQATITGQLKVLEYLIGNKKTDLNIRNNSGRTSVHEAAISGKLDIVKYLVDEKSADISIRDKDRNTILHLAAGKGQLDVVKYLVERKGIDISVKNKFGKKAEDLATKKSYINVVTFLSNAVNSEKSGEANLKAKESDSINKTAIDSKANIEAKEDDNQKVKELDTKTSIVTFSKQALQLNVANSEKFEEASLKAKEIDSMNKAAIDSKANIEAKEDQKVKELDGKTSVVTFSKQTLQLNAANLEKVDEGYFEGKDSDGEASLDKSVSKDLAMQNSHTHSTKKSDIEKIKENVDKEGMSKYCEEKECTRRYSVCAIAGAIAGISIAYFAGNVVSTVFIIAAVIGSLSIMIANYCISTYLEHVDVDQNLKAPLLS